MTRFQLRHLAAAITALSLAVPAFAQYVWLDEKGIKQFSDMPPPASVPANRILKQPSDAIPSSAAPSSPADGAATTVKTEMTTAERNVDYRKRKAEQAEKEKKIAEEARVAAEKTKQCERAREYNRTLESGERISRMDKTGERTFLTDEQRAQEMRDARRVLDGCK